MPFAFIILLVFSLSGLWCSPFSQPSSHLQFLPSSSTIAVRSTSNSHLTPQRPPLFSRGRRLSPRPILLRRQTRPPPSTESTPSCSTSCLIIFFKHSFIPFFLLGDMYNINPPTSQQITYLQTCLLITETFLLLADILCILL